MTESFNNPPQLKPWYREPWPWVAIGIPAAAVVMGFVTLYLALANPDFLVVDEQNYDVIKSELRAQLPSGSEQSAQDATPGREDGDR